MKKHLAFITLFSGAALLIVFAAGKIYNFRNPNGNFLAAIGFQNATSSQGAASSTDNSAIAATSTLTLADALRQFQNQIRSLNSQMADIKSEIEITSLKSIFIRTLKRGDTGDDVSKLQELLMKFPELYPSDTDTSSTVTGFYGSLTKSAVAQFQSETGLQETGIFDSATKEKFYESISAISHGSASTEFALIDISAIADLKISDGSSSQISASAGASTTELQSQAPQTLSDSTSTQADIADLQNQVSQLSSDLADVKSETADLRNQLAALQATPSPPPMSAPSVAIAPASKLAISNIQITNITQRSAMATWTTNSLANSEVDYSTDANLSTSKTLIVSSSTAVTNHAVGLQSLNSGTKYYYWVLSKDNTNTTASSTIQNFNTLN